MALPSRDKQRRIIWNAARKYGIKPSILWGVYGTETAFGSNVSTSTAGAVGPFQFLPSTARGMGVNPYDFHSAAYGAARYLSQYKGRGTAGMLSAYNAGPAGGLVSSYVDSVRRNARSWGKAPISGRGGSRGRRGGGPLPGQIVGQTTRIPGDPGNLDALSLVRAALDHRQQAVAAPVSAPSPPSFWARGALKLPAGYQELASSGAPSGPTDSGVDEALSAARAVSGPTADQLQTTLGRGPDVPGNGSGGGGSKGNYHGKSVPEGALKMLRMAKAFDSHHTTYLWGGGHGSFAHSSDRVDCSGYVSAILHYAGLLDRPMTSGELASWGHPGKGKYVTVWANGGHVLIDILGRFFATSGENPGGGPGARSTPSASYLSAFTPRHPALA